MKTYVDITRPSSWKKYNEQLCESCMGSCCSLAVEANFKDLIRMGVVDAFDEDEPRRKIVKKLKKDGIISLYNNRSDIYTLAQRPNNDCFYLDQITRQCTIYEKRPATCRNHPEIGPRPGFCAYIAKPKKKTTRR